MQIFRSYILPLLIVMVCASGALVAFTHYIGPDEPWAYIVASVLVLLILGTLLTLIFYGCEMKLVHSKLYQQALKWHALRQGLILSAVVVVNMALNTFHAWNVLAAIGGVLVFGLVEFLSLARKVG